MDIREVFQAWEDEAKVEIAKSMGKMTSGDKYACLYGRLQGFLFYALDAKTSKAFFKKMEESVR